jgi:hypothetical protein
VAGGAGRHRTPRCIAVGAGRPGSAARCAIASSAQNGPHQLGFGSFSRLQRQPRTTDHFGVLSIRAARRYRWRLAGGRLTAGSGTVRFTPNRLERRRPDTFWQCPAENVTGVRASRKIWLVVETVSGAEMFRVFGAAAAVPKLEEALLPYVGRHRKPGAEPV